MGYFNGRDAEKTFNNLGVFLLIAFVTELLKIFGEIMVVGDWMTSLVRRQQLRCLLIQSF